MPELTDERLAEIEARAEAATPGPWRWDGMWSAILHFGPFKGGMASGSVCSCTDESMRNGDGSYRSSPRPHDRNFIAHARTDIPALIAELRRLRAERLTAIKTLRAAWKLHGSVNAPWQLPYSFADAIAGPDEDRTGKEAARIVDEYLAARDGGEG